ncbi:MAG: hypothetical protein OXF46_09755 [Rhodobacteraceae bacterium]|nr:hypothetical protein [Paracoccaceae bacterium]
MSRLRRSWFAAPVGPVLGNPVGGYFTWSIYLRNEPVKHLGGAVHRFLEAEGAGF